MKKFLGLAAAVSLIPLACSTVPPKSARTNPIYYPQEIRPPLVFESVPAVQPVPAAPATGVAERYYDFEVWWNQNAWPGGLNDWYMMRDLGTEPDFVSYLHDGCIYTLESVDIWRLRPGLGDAPDISLVTEFIRQEQILAIERNDQTKLTLMLPTHSYGENQAGFTRIIRDILVLRTVVVGDYSASLGAVAKVSSACQPSSRAIDQKRDRTVKIVADSITFVRR